MTIQLAMEKNFLKSDRILQEVRKQIERVFREGMRVDFQFPETIDKDPTGKLRKIVSRVPVA